MNRLSYIGIPRFAQRYLLVLVVASFFPAMLCSHVAALYLSQSAMLNVMLALCGYAFFTSDWPGDREWRVIACISSPLSFALAPLVGGLL